MITNQAQKMYFNYAWSFAIILWVILQIPFLKADPFVSLSQNSRDAFTDEGLNTSQIRNWVNWGDLNVWECDNLIKTPLFNALLAVSFKIFGNYWLTGRLTVLLCAAMFLFIAGYIQTM